MSNPVHKLWTVLLIAGSLAQLGAFQPVIERGGHLDECMKMAATGHAGVRFQMRCGWHQRREIDETVRMR